MGNGRKFHYGGRILQTESVYYSMEVMLDLLLSDLFWLDSHLLV